MPKRSVGRSRAKESDDLCKKANRTWMREADNRTSNVRLESHVSSSGFRSADDLYVP